MSDFPQGATKGVGTSTLNWLRNMPFRDRAELTEWLLEPDPAAPIQPRTDRERKAYVNGWIQCLAMVVTDGVTKTQDTLRIMVECEWPERFDEEGNLKPT